MESFWARRPLRWGRLPLEAGGTTIFDVARDYWGAIQIQCSFSRSSLFPHRRPRATTPLIRTSHSRLQRRSTASWRSLEKPQRLRRDRLSPIISFCCVRVATRLYSSILRMNDLSWSSVVILLVKNERLRQGTFPPFFSKLFLPPQFQKVPATVPSS